LRRQGGVGPQRPGLAERGAASFWHPGGFSLPRWRCVILGKNPPPRAFFPEGEIPRMAQSRKRTHISLPLADDLGHVVREVDDAGRFGDQDPSIDDEIEKFSHFLIDVDRIV
jgi:hypothetical protein